MRTTLELPENLIAEIMELTQSKTINQAVREILEEYLKLIKRKKLVTFKGAINLDIDLDSARNRTDK